MSGVAARAPDALATFCQAVVDDLRQLAVLHARELDADTLRALRAADFPAGLGLRLDEAVQPVLAAVRDEVRGWPEPADAGLLDALAADYAAIYLNHSYLASPQESVWIDDEGLAMQRSMFQVRAWYRRFGLAVEDWRRCPDDHLAHQLQFIAWLLAERGADGLTDAARFMDEHLLRWLGRFAERVATRCQTPFYAGLALLTERYAERLRDLLAQLLDAPRPSAEEIEQRMKPKREVAPVPVRFVPGAAPSW